MKAYQLYIKYRLINSSYHPIDTSYEHLSEYYPTYEAADTYKVFSDSKVFLTLEREVREVDLPNTMTLEGEVNESGQYEDYHVYLQNGEDHLTIDSEIKSMYLGRKVRITVELLDESESAPSGE